jgi:hypothetical protein
VWISFSPGFHSIDRIIWNYGNREVPVALKKKAALSRRVPLLRRLSYGRNQGVSEEVEQDSDAEVIGCSIVRSIEKKTANNGREEGCHRWELSLSLMMVHVVTT